MEGLSMFMHGKIQYSKMLILFKLICKFKAIPINPSKAFVDKDEVF